jgi:hypothetical protein
MQYKYEVYFKSNETDTIKIDGWIPIDIDSINKPENIEKYIENGLLRRTEYNSEELNDVVKPIFLCKLFLNKSDGYQKIVEIRAQIVNYLENNLNNNYEILVIPIIDVYKEPIFELLNVQNITYIDFNKFKDNIEILIKNIHIPFWEEIKMDFGPQEAKKCMNCDIMFAGTINKIENFCSETCRNEMYKKSMQQ